MMNTPKTRNAIIRATYTLRGDAFSTIKKIQIQKFLLQFFLRHFILQARKIRAPRLQN